jgi:putative ABC transport system permease protein
LRDIRGDLEYGLRMLRKTPVLTAVAVLSLGLGIGANTAVLGVMDAVWRVGIPLPHTDRLVAIRSVPPDGSPQAGGVSVHEYLAWKERSLALDAIELSIAGPRDLGTEEHGRPAERITGQVVTPNFFTTLGVQPLAGRLFTDADRTGPRVVIISHRLWQRRYAGDVAILNAPIRLDRLPTIVVGIMAADFQYGDPRVDCWTPFDIDANRSYGTGRFFGVVARLKPGTTIEQAQADLAAISTQLAGELPDRNEGRGVRVQLLGDALFGWTREPLTALQAAATLVLLIACANVAGLLLARASTRQRELALRAAIGARRGRLVRQLLTESLLLSSAGGAAGLVVAWWGSRGLATLTPPLGLPPIAAPAPSLALLGLTGGLAALAGVSFGLAPAIAASRLRPLQLLRQPEHTAAPRSRRIARTALVSAQLALAFVLLIGFGLLAHSFLRKAGRELNFDTADLLTFEVRVPSPQRPLGLFRGHAYFELTSAPSVSLARIHERLRTLPGVVSAAGSSFSPVDSLILPVVDVTLGGRSAGRAAYFLVTPGFFETMKTPVVRGRGVDPGDTAARPWVAIVNEAAARIFWPGGNPIGQSLRLDVVPEELPREVVGVVRDVPVRSGETEPRPVVYASYLQQPSRYRGPWGGMFGQMTYLLRYTGDPARLVAEARRAVSEIEPDRPLGSIMTAGQRLGLGTRKLRYSVFLFAVLASSAVLLAAVGVYGLFAHAVSQMTREIGLRKALGAGTGDVVAVVARHAVVTILGGLLPGCAGALLFGRLIASQLWGIAPADPATFAAVSVVLVAACVFACLAPARRALAVDPAVALRHE